MGADAPVIHIRDSRADETQAIEQLTLQSYEEYSGSMAPDFWAQYRRNIAEAIRQRAPAERVVAEVTGGDLLGSVVFIPATARDLPGALTHGLPEARLLAVRPVARGRGIGRALMTECVARARHAGAEFLYLHTTDMMRTALHLYERMGFVRAPEQDFSPAHGLLVKGYRLAL